MSQENVELVRAAVDAVNGATWRRACALCDPDVEWHPRRCAVEAARSITDTTESADCVPTAGRGLATTRRSRSRSCVDAGEDCGRRRLSGRARAGAATCRSSSNAGAGHVPRRQDQRRPSLPRPRRGPRSRGAVGVGDVAGERGDRAARVSKRSNRGDLDAAVELARPGVDVEWRCPSAERRCPGREASRVQQWMRASSWEGLGVGIETTEMMEAWRRRGRRHRAIDGRGRGSGVAVDERADGSLDRSRRQGRRRSTLFRERRRSPRSRGAVGVGDVAGERGDSYALASTRFNAGDVAPSFAAARSRGRVRTLGGRRLPRSRPGTRHGLERADTRTCEPRMAPERVRREGDAWSARGETELSAARIERRAHEGESAAATFRDGRIIGRGSLRRLHAEALEAVGLSE